MLSGTFGRINGKHFRHIGKRHKTEARLRLAGKDGSYDGCRCKRIGIRLTVLYQPFNAAFYHIARNAEHEQASYNSETDIRLRREFLQSLQPNKTDERYNGVPLIRLQLLADIFLCRHFRVIGRKIYIIAHNSANCRFIDITLIKNLYGIRIKSKQYDIFHAVHFQFQTVSLH